MSRHDSTQHQLSDDGKQKLEARIKELELENLDLKITNRGKDYFVDELKNERERFEAERKEMVHQLIQHSHRVGELEGVIRHAQIEAPRQQEKKAADQDSNIIDVTPENTKDEQIEERTSNVLL
jgi:hypothetical protein